MGENENKDLNVLRIWRFDSLPGDRHRCTMKIAAQVAVVGACLAVPVLYNSPSKLALFASAALASFYLLRPPRAVVDENELPPQRRGICMDRYTDSKVPEHLDVIVIGSGMSGLSCASVLARMGKRVLVLEQHDRTGGGTHMYELGPGIKYSFDSGLHYVVPECAKLLQLCTGGEKVPVDFDLMGAPPSPDGEADDATGPLRFPVGQITLSPLFLPHCPLYLQFPHSIDFPSALRESHLMLTS